jgi:hypothetical protein
MTEPTAPSPEALPGTYTKKKDAIIALRALAKHTGHKLVVPNHGSTNITLRCKGFSTTGCTFKVCVYVPIDQQGTEQATWMLDHGKQIWKHTCNPATSAASSSVATSAISPRLIIRLSDLAGGFVTLIPRSVHCWKNAGLSLSHSPALSSISILQKSGQFIFGSVLIVSIHVMMSSEAVLRTAMCVAASSPVQSSQ